jgi:hypothetical protein
MLLGSDSDIPLKFSYPLFPINAEERAMIRLRNQKTFMRIAAAVIVNGG